MRAQCENIIAIQNYQNLLQVICESSLINKVLYYRAVWTMTGYSLQPSKLKSISFSLSQLFLIFWKGCLWVLPAKVLQNAKLPLENKGMEFASKLPKKDMLIPWNIWKSELTWSFCAICLYEL